MRRAAYSFWDRQSRASGSSTPTLLDACLARTQPFEHFGKLDTAGREQLTLEYRRRVEYWTEQARSAKLWMIFTLGLLALLLACASAVIVATGLEAVMLFILAFIAVAVTVIGFHSLLQFYRLGRALDQQRCPDCAYDLSRATPAIDPAVLDGAFIGPQRCPECGALWPMVPAAIPQSVS